MLQPLATDFIATDADAAAAAAASSAITKIPHSQGTGENGVWESKQKRKARWLKNCK